jgi:hypothetical protein
MPKESVFGPSALACDPNAVPSSRLDVAWGNDSKVEVGILKPVTGTVDIPWFDDGFWLVLDRQQVNRLIATLRKARDQAYGADQ